MTPADLINYHRDQSARYYAKARDLVTGYGMTRAVYSVMWWQSRDNWTSAMEQGRWHHEAANMVLVLLELCASARQQGRGRRALAQQRREGDADLHHHA